MNTFDAVVTVIAVLAMAIGFKAGLLRSLAAILAYLIAAPIAVALTPRVTGLFTAHGLTQGLGQGAGHSTLPSEQSWIALFVVFVALGILISLMLRNFVDGFAGDEIGLFDRIAGALLGAVRIFLVAVLIVVVFDRLIPSDRQPAFLVGSKLRPYLSAAGQKGLQTLPSEMQAYIDNIKRERGL
jgi:membrane protein required for colicin V production